MRKGQDQASFVRSAWQHPVDDQLKHPVELARSSDAPPQQPRADRFRFTSFETESGSPARTPLAAEAVADVG
jgi:hypothetical protein